MKKDSNLEENASAFETGGIRVSVLESSSNACKYFLKKDKGFMSVSMDERLEMKFLTKMFTMFSRFCHVSTNQRKVLIWFYLELS